MKEVTKGFYRHFKGGLCEVIEPTAVHTETEEVCVVYRDESGDVWVRPKSMFIESVNGQKRFTPFSYGDSREDSNNEKREYLACKKCHGDRHRLLVYAGGGYKVSCPLCSYCTKMKKTADEAVRAWNQR